LGLHIGTKAFALKCSTYPLEVLVFEKKNVGFMPTPPESQDVVPDGAQWNWKRKQFVYSGILHAVGPSRLPLSSQTECLA